MSGFINFAGGTPSQPPNPNKVTQLLGFQADGGGVTVTSGASNAKGNYSDIGTTGNALSEIILFVSIPAAQRLFVDLRYNVGAFTTTIASPGVVTLPGGHDFANGDAVCATTTGALPTGLTAGTTYYIVNLSGNTCNLAATQGGSAINTSGTQSGTHTIHRVFVSDMPLSLSNIAGADDFALPLRVPAGKTIAARTQASAATQVPTIAITGTDADPLQPPGFTAMEPITPMGATTICSSVSVLASSSGPTWTELRASTFRAYGAFWSTVQDSVHSASQRNTFLIGAGAAAAEAELGRFYGQEFNSSASTQAVFSNVFFNQLASGSRLAGGYLAPTPGSNAVRQAVLGFY